MEEIWCDISDYKGLYQVSTLGRVRSLDRIIYDQGRHWFQNGKILKASSQKSGYLFVTLSKAGKAKQYRVHRLVAQAFIPNPSKLPQVNHKDEDVTNNKVENLEWCTAKYNLNYGNHNQNVAKTLKQHKYQKIAIENGRKASTPVLKFTLDGKFLEKYSSQVEAAKNNNIRQGSVSNCCRGKVKQVKGYIYKYLEEHKNESN